MSLVHISHVFTSLPVVLASCRQIMQSDTIPSSVHSLLLSFNKLQGLLPRHYANRARLSLETDAIALLGHKKHLWSERGANELAG
jgi:hypothetical protein